MPFSIVCKGIHCNWSSMLSASLFSFQPTFAADTLNVWTLPVLVNVCTHPKRMSLWSKLPFKMLLWLRVLQIFDVPDVTVEVSLECVTRDDEAVTDICIFLFLFSVLYLISGLLQYLPGKNLSSSKHATTTIFTETVVGRRLQTVHFISNLVN